MIRGRVHISLLLFAVFSHLSLVSFNFFSGKDRTSVIPLRELPSGALDPAQVDLPSSSKNYFKQLKISKHDQLVLPSSLRNLKNFELCHLLSTQQEGNSCCWYQA